MLPSAMWGCGGADLPKSDSPSRCAASHGVIQHTWRPNPQCFRGLQQGFVSRATERATQKPHFFAILLYRINHFTTAVHICQAALLK